MAITGELYPSAASGWTGDYGSLSPGGGEATAVAFSSIAPTANLVCSNFWLTAGGHTSTIGVYVRISCKILQSNNSAWGGLVDNGGSLTVYLARNGVPISSQQVTTVTGYYETYLFSFDGSAIGDAQIRNLQVVAFCSASALSNCYIDSLTAQCDYVDTDAQPDAFILGSVSSVPFSSVQTSSPITLSGLSDSASVFVVGGEYEKNGSGIWTTSDGEAVNGDSLKVRHTAAATGSTAKVTTLTVGGVSSSFTSTTEATDSTPDAFTFAAVLNAERSVSSSSEEITVAGINVPVAISITGGQYQVDGGAWTSSAGTITVGKKVKVKLTTSALFSTLANATLTIGGFAAAYNVTTKASIGTPTAFSFTNQLNVATSTLRTSETITIAGLDAAVNVTVTDGELSKNGGAWSTSATTCTNGDTFAVRHTSAAGASSIVTTTLQVGNFAESFSSTTAGADITPSAFSFTAKSDTPIGRYVTSQAATISGINVATPVNVVGGMVSCNGGAYARFGSVTSGQTVAVRLDPIYQAAETKTATVYIGESGAVTFSATTTTNYYIAM